MLTAPKFSSKSLLDPMSDGDPLLRFAAPWANVAVQYFATLAMTGVATLAAVGFDYDVTIPNLSLIFVVPVIIAAVGFGLGPSLFASILGALAYNFFLVDPRYTLRVDDPANLWAIGLLVVVGCIASAVASTSKRRADELALQERQASLLRSYERELLEARGQKEIAEVTVRTTADLFRVPAMVMREGDGGSDDVVMAGAIELQEAELDAAHVALTAGGVVRAGVYPADASRFDFWPVPVRVARPTAIGLAFDPDERPPAPGVLVEIVAGFMALALDRQQLEATKG